MYYRISEPNGLEHGVGIKSWSLVRLLMLIRAEERKRALQASRARKEIRGSLSKVMKRPRHEVSISRIADPRGVSLFTETYSNRAGDQRDQAPRDLSFDLAMGFHSVVRDRVMPDP